MLGPISVGLGENDREPFSTVRVRTLLAALLLQRNEYVSMDRLAESVWPDPPVSADANLRTHASALRAALERASAGLSRRLHTRRGVGGAYRLIVEHGELDVDCFYLLAERGRRELLTGQQEAAARTLTEALGLWRGTAGDDLPDTSRLRLHHDALHERRRAVHEDLLQARIDAGQPQALVHDLRTLVAETPLRERPVELLMRALYLAGDQPAALAEFLRYRDRLGEETGSEPSPQAYALYAYLLRHEPQRPRAPSRMGSELVS
jgi:DNA-binding SARP family transcriptional activator